MKEMITFPNITSSDFAKEYNKYQDPNIGTRPLSPLRREVVGCEGHEFHPDPSSFNETDVRGLGIIILRVARP
ncbi:hypothetical protein SE18_08450 [Herpetosiphon geysericola]|uniref:Uncharacterized protein n=1 Tax=Herpetosiphon geysericola TaxID=70996 RepID=A0A0P6YZU4_9CHLR|nr:hypothetical protein SE18_08450 [Herpetosiphon geysericola]